MVSEHTWPLLASQDDEIESATYNVRANGLNYCSIRAKHYGQALALTIMGGRVAQCVVALASAPMVAGSASSVRTGGIWVPLLWLSSS